MFRVGIGVGAAEIFLISQPTVPHHHQPAMLDCVLGEFESLIQPGAIYSSFLHELRVARASQGTPTALTIRGREVLRTGHNGAGGVPKEKSRQSRLSDIFVCCGTKN